MRLNKLINLGIKLSPFDSISNFLSIPQSLNPSIPQSLNPSIPQSLNPSIPQSLNPSIPQSLNLISIPQSHLISIHSIPQSLNPSISSQSSQSLNPISSLNLIPQSLNLISNPQSLNPSILNPSIPSIPQSLPQARPFPVEDFQLLKPIVSQQLPDFQRIAEMGCGKKGPGAFECFHLRNRGVLV